MSSYIPWPSYVQPLTLTEQEITTPENPILTKKYV